MGTSIYTSLLVNDYRRKLGDVAQIRKAIRELCRTILQLETEIGALAALIRSREPGVDLGNLRAIRTTPRINGFRKGTLRRMVLQCLKDAGGESLGPEAILAYVVDRRGEVLNREELGLLRLAIRKALKTMVADGRVIRHHSPRSNKPGAWSAPMQRP